MSAYAFTALFNSFVAIAFGIWVFVNNPRSHAHRRWLMLSIGICVWTFSQFMREMSVSVISAELWGRYGVYLASTMIPVLYFHFIIEFMGDIVPFGRRLLPFFYSMALILLLAVYKTSLIVKGVVPNPFFRYYTDPGKYYFLFLFHFGGIFLISLIFKIVGAKRAASLKKDQLKIMVAAFLISVLGGSTSFLPVLKINVFPFGNYFVSLYVFLYSYLIVKHQWMDIDIFLRKSLSLFVVILTLVIPLFILTVLGQNFFFSQVNPFFTILIIGTMVLAVVTFPAFRLKAERTIEQFLFPQKRDNQQTIARLSQEAVSILDLDKLLGSLVNTLSRNLQTSRVAVLVLDEKREQYRIKDSTGYPRDFVDNTFLSLHSPWVEYFQRNPETLYKETASLSRKEKKLSLKKIFYQLDADLVVPLVVKSRMAGIIVMGEKEKGHPYSMDDLDLLRTLANQAAIAIENARLYEDLKRSRQYIRRADRLASLGTLAAGLAHEIRNPLVSIKTFVQLLPQRIDDDDFRTNFLNIANDEVERIGRLVEELLSFARPSEPNLQLADLNEIIEKTLLLVENDLKSKGIILTRSLDGKMPDILIDKEQIKQVILNIIINAIQANPPEGRIRVETRTVGLSGPKVLAQVEISDNGPGIGEEDLDNIFNPFFTTKQMGSGLGLAISHQIIKEHHGSIEVESSPGRGTGFFINLPLDPRKFERRKKVIE